MIPAGAMYITLNDSLGEKKAFVYSVILACVVGLTVKYYVGRFLESSISEVYLQTANSQISNLPPQNVYADRLAWAVVTVTFSEDDSNAAGDQFSYAGATTANSQC